MTEAKSTPKKCRCGKVLTGRCEGRTLCLECEEKESLGESTQPQLPPRPTPIGYEQEKRCCTVCDAKKLCSICSDATLYACMDCQIDLAATVYVCSKRSCRDLHELKCPHRLRAENESLKAHSEQYRQNWLSLLRELGCECHVDALELIARIKAERDKMLEVVREYREGSFAHPSCAVGHEDPCPTCIKADALLPKEKL